jgi:hypothetical protein
LGFWSADFRCGAKTPVKAGSAARTRGEPARTRCPPSSCGELGRVPNGSSLDVRADKIGRPAERALRTCRRWSDAFRWQAVARRPGHGLRSDRHSRRPVRRGQNICLAISSFNATTSRTRIMLIKRLGVDSGGMLCWPLVRSGERKLTDEQSCLRVSTSC